MPSFIKDQLTTELQRTIVEDRYARKAAQEIPPVNGQTVLVVEPNRRRRARVVAYHPDSATVTVQMHNPLGEPTEEITVPRARIEIPIEDIEAIMHRVARAISTISPHMHNAYIDMLLNAEFIPGGRILTMAGRKAETAETAYNCYVIPSPKDSRRQIFQSLADMADIMATGGGVGINVSTLRPRYARVKGVNGRASGAVSWGALFSTVTGLIEQAGSRRGALMVILNDWHPDLEEFINSKRTAGQITNANISVGISNAFMHAVKNDLAWSLQFPDTAHPTYNQEWDGNLTAWKHKGYPVITYKTIPARQLWNAIIESAWASAEPGIWFTDRSNDLSNSYYYAPLVATNPCITGDMLIPSRDGMIRAHNLSYPTAIPTDARLSPSPHHHPTQGTFQTGTKPVFRLTTREGYSLDATADHRIMTNDGWKPLSELVKGERVHIANYQPLAKPVTSLNNDDYRRGKILGWYVGDGSWSEGRAILLFYGAKHDLAQWYRDAVNALIHNPNRPPVEIWKNPKYDGWRIASKRLAELLTTMGVHHDNKLRVPNSIWTGSLSYQRGFLSALFDADGSVQNAPCGNRIFLTSISLELLHQVQLLLLQFNIVCTIRPNIQPAKLRVLPDHRGVLREYWCNAVHRLDISKDNIRRFAEQIGFDLVHKSTALAHILMNHNLMTERFTARVDTIEPMGEQTVYDLTEPVTHSFIANGFVVHNCGEQPLPPNAVCNLGAINLARFYDPLNHDIDWTRLHEVVTAAVNFLDDVIDYTPYVNAEVEQTQKSERRIGLGSMGIAELFIRLRVRYGSPECLAWIDRIFAFIASTAYRASANLASRKGVFRRYDDKMLQSQYMQNLFQADPTLEEYIRLRGGLRNITLLTQAPTGTTGTMVNTSTGLEPYFSWSYTREGRLGIYTEHVPLVAEYYATHPDATSLPNYFVTAMELTPEQHVRVQATFQRWIDSAISKTCNVPNDYTVEQVGQLYEYMYDLGCKGGTVYRDGSRAIQVLTQTTVPTLKLGNVCPSCLQDTLEAESGCQRCINPDCGYTACEVM